MPYYYYDDIDAAANIACSALALGATVVLGTAFLIGASVKAICDEHAEAKAEEERLEAERKRNEEIARRFGDKKAAIISTAQIELEHMSETNAYYLHKLKENPATIGTTYATFTFKVPPKVYKISNPALSASFETIKNMQLNINGDKRFAANLQNNSDFIETLKLRLFEVKEGDIVTIEVETYNDHEEIEDLSLYLFVDKGKQIQETYAPSSLDLNNPVFTYYSNYYQAEGYGTVDFVLFNRAKGIVVKADLDIIYARDGIKHTQTISIDCNSYFDLIT